ncbi:MAG: hypothetical protein OQJ87_07560 [Rhodospirillales bacterium]|nr:hypothetical protein [Rhodospirillales bacterium]MCW8952913.1 hypothetical protein [Rhodospirillales bacterium]MCW8970263.1 hypothetical protein [Rhodospirillales bacterium]MCW9002563.1 hypothetical protein [Rhodospirillales bacterium]MCW9039922.1 hypothetical protein [Rhodospirillales bacterium]
MTGNAGAGSLEDFIGEAIACLSGERWDDLEESTDVFFKQDKGSAIEAFIRSLIAFNRNDLAKAAELAMDGFEAEGETLEFAQALSVYFALAGDLNNSTFHRKLETTLTSDPVLARLLKAGLPDFSDVYLKIEEAPLLKKGRKAFFAGQWEDAEFWFGQHLAFFPENGDAYVGSAQSLIVRNQYRAAIDLLRAARHVLPNNEQIASVLALTLTDVGEFPESRACHRWAVSQAPDNLHIAAMAMNDMLADPEQDGREVARRVLQWGKQFGLRGLDASGNAADADKKTLTVAYLLGSRGLSSSGTALSDIIARHDPRRFKAIGIGLGSFGNSYNATFQKCFERWHDIAGMDPYTLRSMVAAEGVDIVINASGFEAPELLTAFGSRMAPCQVSWMGTPYGTGLECMDALLSDAYVDGSQEGKSDITESLAQLSLGSFLADLPEGLDRPERTSSSDGGVVFATDTPLSGVNSITVECWSRILHEVPDSVLILRDHGFKTDVTINRLLALFGNFGVSHRIDIVSDVDRFTFLADADVVLLPYPEADAQLTLDALWMGAPAICLVSDDRHTRLAGSLLSQLGLAERMVGETLGSYVNLAVEWANDKDRRAAFRTEAGNLLDTADCLDHHARARDLEAALESMWRKACGG